MKKLYTLVIASFVSALGFGQISITNLANPYTQDFNTLANTGTTSSVLPTGWLLSETDDNANTTYSILTTTSNSGDTYSFGTVGATDRAFGGLLSGTLVPTIGVGFTNNSGATINSITINYTGEQWRLGVANRADRLDFQYSTTATGINAGTYTDLDALDFVAPNTTGTVGVLDGNLAANKTAKTVIINGLNIPNGTSFYFRWNDFNATGADDGLGIDDVTINFSGTVQPACVAPTAQPTASSTAPSTTLSTVTAPFVAAAPAADAYLVVRSIGALSGLPTDGTNYDLGDAVGTNGTVVSSDAATTISDAGLAQSTTYTYTVFSLNEAACTGGPIFLTASPLVITATTATPAVCAAPNSAGTVSNIVLSASSTTINGSFTPDASADGTLVVVSTVTPLGFTPTNGTAYSVGQLVGTGGVVVKYGTGGSFTATGLTPSTPYFISFFPVNAFNCTGGPLYNPNPTPASISTAAPSVGGWPAGYYDAITNQTCENLKTALYTRTSTLLPGSSAQNYNALYTQYAISDIKPREVGTGSANVIYDIYSEIPGPANDPYNFTPITQEDRGSCPGVPASFNGESSCYNREHSVPQSWFNGSTGSVGTATDYLFIYPTDKEVNAVRSNFIYGEVASATRTTLNGSKLGTSAIAGFNGPVFEPINEFKGDLARAFLYFVTRYQPNIGGYPGAPNNTYTGTGIPSALPFNSSTNGGTYPSVQIEYLRLMLKWAAQDPVSQREMDRNNAAQNHQGNRNPFIDHPEYVDMVWNSNCQNLQSLPVDLLLFRGYATGENIMLKWDVANEVNLLSYELQRSLNGKDFNTINSTKPNGSSTYTHSDNISQLTGRRVYYRLKTIDKDGKYSYSPVFSIHTPLQDAFNVYPNPVLNKLVNLQLAKPATKNTLVQVLDMQGRITNQIPVALGTINMQVNLKNTANGTYIIKLIQAGTTQMQKVNVL
jgi:endonuclease I